jgi:hypothetical protein
MTIIEFDPVKAQANLDAAAAKRTAENVGIPELTAAIDAAQQAYKSLELINNGYAGSGLKAEIAQAQTLPEHLAQAGRIIQSIALRNGS